MMVEITDLELFNNSKFGSCKLWICLNFQDIFLLFFPIDKLHLAVQPARKAEVAKVVHCNASKRQKENNERPDNSHTF